MSRRKITPTEPAKPAARVRKRSTGPNPATPPTVPVADQRPDAPEPEAEPADIDALLLERDSMLRRAFTLTSDELRRLVDITVTLEAAATEVDDSERQADLERIGAEAEAARAADLAANPPADD